VILTRDGAKPPALRSPPWRSLFFAPHLNDNPGEIPMNFMQWLARGVAAIAAAAMVSAHAAAPQVKAQAPGYYRMMVGDIEVTALFDGALPLEPTKLLTNTTPAEVTRLLRRSFETEPLPTSVNAFLINTGDKLVMVDAGTGTLFGPDLGSLVANLKAAGYQPEQVDEIYITHLHADHVGGLTAGDKPVFANAVVRADQHDADFWLSAANADKAPDELKGFFQMAKASLDPYIAAGRFKAFDGDTPLLPGIRAVAARGHTAGHSVYVVESKGRKLVLWGDLMHVAAVQFPHPEVTIQFDTDSKAAMAQRKKAYALAAKEGHLVGAAHLPFPGLGHLRRDGTGYVFVPVDYTPVK
jgi:glyoxylase-like metal-dependent hydrolase (beta-lactamase superfamily II)